MFFWPGTHTGPNAYGRRHFARYAADDCVVLCIPTAALVTANPPPGPRLEVCRHNFGSPRCTTGRKSPRGPRTIVGLEDFDGTAGEVVEVTFLGRVNLPVDDMRVARVGEV